MRYLLLSIAFSLLGLLIYIAFTNAHRQRENVSETVYEVKTDTFYKTDTLFIERPIPKKVEVIRFDTITRDTILETKRQTYKDTLICAPDTVELQITTQGINVEVEQVEMSVKRQELTKTVTVERIIEINKDKRWTFGITTSMGYGLCNRQPDIYVGIGLTYNLWKK